MNCKAYVRKRPWPILGEATIQIFFRCIYGNPDLSQDSRFSYQKIELCPPQYDTGFLFILHETGQPKCAPRTTVVRKIPSGSLRNIR